MRACVSRPTLIRNYLPNPFWLWCLQAQRKDMLSELPFPVKWMGKPTVCNWIMLCWGEWDNNFILMLFLEYDFPNSVFIPPRSLFRCENDLFPLTEEFCVAFGRCTSHVQKLLWDKHSNLPRKANSRFAGRKVPAARFDQRRVVASSCCCSYFSFQAVELKSFATHQTSSWGSQFHKEVSS